MLQFNGRPDGLGNRIEELINIESYCIQQDVSCNYYWNNIYNFRSYPILLNCKNIIIQDKEKHTNVNLKLTFGEFENNQMSNASKNINYYEQINTDIRKELIDKLEEFATYNDSLEEVFENKEQIEVSKFYERLPKPHALAVQEWLNEKIYYRNADDDSQEK
jgi:hypothetical protein